MDDPRGTWARLRADARRSRTYQASKFGYLPCTWFLDPGFVCVLLHRLAHAAHRRGRTRLARLLMQLGSLLTGADIQPTADLGAGVLIPSPCGTNISGRAGPGLTVRPLAGIGGSVRDRDVGAGIGLPVLGRDVTVNWFAGVQGSIAVGDGVTFGPGASATADIVAGTHQALKVLPIQGVRPAPLPPQGGAAPACLHASWAATRGAMRADVERWRAEVAAYAPGQPRTPWLSAALTNGVLALAAHRMSHCLHCRGWIRPARALATLNLLLHKVTIPPETCLGDGVLMPHLAGLVVACQAGPGLTLYASTLCTALGDAGAASAAATPRLGNDVLVGGHAAALGPVHIGTQAQLGPKAQVVQDLEPYTQAYDRLALSGASGIRPPRPANALPEALAPDRPWGTTHDRMRADRARLPPGAGFPGSTCVRLYRLSHACHVTSRRRLARWLWLLNVYWTGADIAPASRLGAGLRVPHPAGVSVHGCAGEGLTLGAMAGIGATLDVANRVAPLTACPVLGARVELAHHSGVFGIVTVGDGASLQPGCVAERDVPDGVALLPRRLRLRHPTGASGVAGLADPLP